MSKEREILKAGLWYTLGNILVKAIAFLSLPIFTNLLTPEEFGVFGTYQAYETIITVFMCLGISGTVRTAYNDYSENFDRYISSIIFPVIAIFLLLIVVDIVYAISFKDNYISLFVLALILNCLGNSIRDILSSRYIILNKYKQNLLMSLLTSVLNIGISYYLCVAAFSDHKDLGRIWGTVFASLIVAFVFLAFQLRNSSKIIWPKAWKYAILLGLPLILHQLSISVLGQSDKIMIQKLIGSSSAGIYSSMVTIMLVPQAVLNSLDNAWAPWFFKVIRNPMSISLQKEIQLFNRNIIWLFVFIIILFQLISAEIVEYMVGNDYREGLVLLYIFSISVFANLLYIFAVNVEYYYKKMVQISVFTSISAFLNIIFNIIGIYFWGYIGAAFSTVLSRFVLLYLHTIQARKLLGYDCVNISCIIFSLSIVCTFSFFVYSVRDQFFIRAFIGIILFVSLVYFAYTKFYKIK